MDSLEQFKKSQKQSWASFIPFEFVTTRTAAYLVRLQKSCEGNTCWMWDMGPAS